MATVVGITADRAAEIEDASVVSGVVDSSSGHLLLTTQGGTVIDAGLVTASNIDLAEVVLTGTLAEFNTALSDGDFATLAGSETLTNKTLASPTITGVGEDRVVFKSADESVVSSTALQNDDHLLFTVEANAKYALSGDFYVDPGGGAGGLSLAINGPALTALKFSRFNSGAEGFTTAYDSPLNVTSVGTHVAGYIQCSAAGTVYIRWAQATAHATPAKMLLGSHLRIRRVA